MEIKQIVIICAIFFNVTNLFAQTKSVITPLSFCYYGDDITFKYNFKLNIADSVSFTIYSTELKKEIDIVLKKGVKETITLHHIGNQITIHYKDSNIKRSKKVNFNNYQCGGKTPSKHTDDE